MQTLTFRVTGRVQHVWFRGWTVETAHVLGLSGWVRNLPDGSVEGRAQGGRAVLDRFVELLQEGPVSARVVGVETGFSEAPERFAGFVVRS